MVRLALTSGNWAFELRPGLNKLGRNPTNDFRISDPSVSSFHAEIDISNGSVVVRDLASTNGTFVNAQKVEEAELRPGATLRLGHVEFKLEEVTVIEKVCATKTPAGESRPAEKSCAYHADVQASYACENCGGNFCENCVKVVGHDRLGTMTMCPVCKGQCNHLPLGKQAQPKDTMLQRLTQTLKLPFVR